jgi:filamentous hemagglutinin
MQAGTLTNVGSLITAGVKASINVAGPVVNQEQTLNAYWHSHWVQETGMFSSDKRHEQWGCGSAAECTALYGSAYTSECEQRREELGAEAGGAAYRADPIWRTAEDV